MVRRWFFRVTGSLVVVVGIEALYALLRPAPRLPEFDISSTFGNEELPGLRVVVLGDSTITSPGVSGPDEIWISLICRRLSETHHVVVQSFAVGGSKAHDLVEEQLEPALEFEPDLVFLSVGANDALRGVKARKFEEDLGILVSRFREIGAIVVQSGVGDLGSIPRFLPPLRHLFSRRAARFNKIHEQIAAEQEAWVVPQRDSPPELWYKDRGMWSDDLFHVSSRGHLVWADLGWQTVQNALNLS